MRAKHGLLIIRIIMAILLIQTLRFKFTAHPDSVFIFNKLGLEPIGRILIGVLELIASILILIPRTIWAGSLLVVSIMGGAILMHLTILGMDIKGDNGQLFYMAVFTFVLGLISLWFSKKDIPFLKIK